MNETIQKSDKKKEAAQTSVFDMLKKVQEKEKGIKEEKKTISSNEQNGGEASASTTTTAVSSEWHEDEIRLLVKGVKIFAVGTMDR